MRCGASQGKDPHRCANDRGRQEAQRPELPGRARDLAELAESRRPLTASDVDPTLAQRRREHQRDQSMCDTIDLDQIDERLSGARYPAPAAIDVQAEQTEKVRAEIAIETRSHDARAR